MDCPVDLQFLAFGDEVVDLTLNIIFEEVACESLPVGPINALLHLLQMLVDLLQLLSDFIDALRCLLLFDFAQFADVLHFVVEDGFDGVHYCFLQFYEFVLDDSL
jgi:hypothetical protein